MTEEDDPRSLEERLLSGYFPFLWRAGSVILIITLIIWNMKP